MEELTLEYFEGAFDLVREVTTETKLIYSEYFSTQTGNRVYPKPGNMQYTGVYRVRGAYYKISTLSDEEKSKSLITTSTGNYAQDVAYTTKLTGVKATVVMPTITPLMKVDCTKGYSAEVVLESDVFDEACGYAYKLAEKHRYISVHPFDDLAVAIGQGIIAIEVIKELLTVNYILAPVGRGGLHIGVSTLTKLFNPKIKVIDVEPAGVNCIQESPRQGQVTTLPEMSTTADGAVVKRLGEKLFPYTQQNADDITTIENSELTVSLPDMMGNHRMIMEDSGLLTVTALKHPNIQKRKIVSILSGGDMDMITISSTVQHGLIQRDRVFTVSVFLPDKSGKLVRVSSPLAKEQDNTIKSRHNQFISISHSAAMELRITIEAFGTDYKNQIVAVLTGAGCRPKLVKFKGTYSEMQWRM